MRWIKNLLGLESNQDPDDFITKSMILDQINQERSVYLSIFAKEIASLKHRELNYKTEVQILLESTKIPEVFRQARADALYKKGLLFEQVEVSFANPAGFKPMHEEWRGIEVSLYPCVWHALEVHVIGPMPDMTQLQNWFIRWFDPNDRNKANENELHKVIHSMTPPRAIADGWMVTIDFGSCGMDAFLAFFKQCRFNKATKIEIKSDAYLNQLKSAMTEQIE